MKLLLNVSIFVAFLLLATFIGIFLWQALFSAKMASQPTVNASTTELKEGLSGRAPLQSSPNVTEDALVEYTKWLAIFTAFLVLATIALFVSGERNVEVARRSAMAAQESARVARDTLVATNRPWVSVDLAINGPLTFTPDEARIEISFILTNTGSSPAINVQVNAEIALFMDNGKTPLDVMKAVCKRAKDSPDDRDPVLGHTIFKDRKFVYSVNLGKKKADIENALANFKDAGKNEWFVPAVVGCVSYRFPFQRGRHVTEFMADVRKINPVNPKVPGSFKMSDGDVPPDKMVLTRSFIGGNAD